jgi:hypothetical protein
MLNNWVQHVGKTTAVYMYLSLQFIAYFSFIPSPPHSPYNNHTRIPSKSPEIKISYYGN